MVNIDKYINFIVLIDFNAFIRIRLYLYIE